MKYEIVIEKSNGDLEIINSKSNKRAMNIANRYCKNYRVMINKLDEEYGTCENIFDNKDVIDTLNKIEDELNKTIGE